MKRSNTRRSLWFSVLSLLLCVSMLIGTTYAWFTDRVTSGYNTIVAGNLDIELYWSTDASNWQKVTETTNVFREEYWEPGHTEVVYLKVVNEGSLALKYRLGVNVVSETEGVNTAGKLFKLSNYIKFGAVETQTAYTDRAEAIAAVPDADVISAGITKATKLMNTGDTNYLAMVVYMPESVGNEANPLTDDVAPVIHLGINLVATQFTKESDVFDDQYDIDAIPCDVIATPDTINDVLANAKGGEVIGLADGTYDQIVITQNDLTLVSNTAVVGYVNLNAKDNCRLIGVTFDAAKAQPTYQMTQTAGCNEPTGMYASIVAAENSADGANNAQIINCNFFGKPVDASVYIPIAFYEKNRNIGGSEGITVDDCTFSVNALYYVYVSYPGAGDHMVRNNVFGDGDKVAANAVYFGSTKGNVSIINNVFLDSGVTITPYNNESCSYGLKISIVDNHFFNSTDGAISVIGMRAFHKLPKCNTIVKDNVANGGMSVLSSAYESGNYVCYDLPVSPEPLTAVCTPGTFVSATQGGRKVFLVDDVIKAAKASEMILHSNGRLIVEGAGTVIVTRGVGTTPGVSQDYGYVGFVPKDGDSALINNVTVVGTGFVEVGEYKKGNKYTGNFEINNLIVKNMKTTLISPDQKLVSSAFTHYGKAVMNNCVVTGSACSELPEERGAEAFDVGFAHGTKTVANNCTFGKIYLWSQAFLTLNDCEVDYIDTCTVGRGNNVLGKLTLDAGTHVGTINVFKIGSYNPTLEIREGATVDKIIYNGTTYTQAEWVAMYPAT